MKLRTGILLLTAALLLPRAAVAALTASGPTPAASTIIILDASFSMHEQIKGEAKIDIAKRAVRELVESLPADVRLGLVAYGHRKGSDCSDIELLIPPDRLDKRAFVAAVEGLKPRGMTPLTAALEFTALSLDYTTKPANIILVSDGVETCGKDPCAMAAKLKAAGANLVIHTVGFDLSARDAKSIRCIANATGGQFLQAKDAASLKDALAVVVAEAVMLPPPAPPSPPKPVAAAVTAPPPQPPVVIPVTLKVPPAVVAGTTFSVEWTGPNKAGDTITIVPKGTPDDDDGNLAYTQQGTPLQLTALLDPGDAEVRYVAGRSHAVLARAPLKIKAAVEATLDAVPEAAAGSVVKVTWKGPNNEGDFITIVLKTTRDADYERSVPTRDGSPSAIATPMETGEGEIRYLSGQNNRVLARRPIKILPPHIVLAAADEGVAGSVVSITWEGPNYPDDYITIVAKTVPDGQRGGFAYTLKGSPSAVTAPAEAGDCEIRYMTGWGHKVLARRSIKIVAGLVTLNAPDKGVAGSEVAIVWTGPNNENDFITVVPKATPDGSRESFAWTQSGSPAQVTAPGELGAAEIRYIAGIDNKVLGRRPITVVAATITLRAPARAPAGTPVSIEWTGPNNMNDTIAIVPQGAPDGTSGRYAWTAAGSPANIDPPDEPGPYEVRYISGQNDRVLAHVPLAIGAAGTELLLPSPAVTLSAPASTVPDDP